MKKFKLYDIEWDTDDDLVNDNELPKFEFIDSNFSLKELRESKAADFLSDAYGFCVKSLKVDYATEKMFTVFIERTERYSIPVNVLAGSITKAIDKIAKMNMNGKFDDKWDELQPGVSYKYEAAESENEGNGEGPLV